MARATHIHRALCFGLALLPVVAAFADDDAAAVREELRQLREENRQLRQQLDTLSGKVATLEGRQESVAAESAKPASTAAKVIVSGEGGVGFFQSGHEGMFPNSEFRVDEAKLFVDAQVLPQVFVFGEINLILREGGDTDLDVGELYVEVADISRLWGRDGQLNLRVGALDIPFGEEYLTRDAIDNPLIAHSIFDLWGVDEGVELFGSLGRFRYVVAVQNGGIPSLRDFDADKSVAGRVSFDPNNAWHFSVSAMRTGNIHATDDFFTAMWLGPGFISSLGGLATTTFRSDLYEVDATWRGRRGHVALTGGYIGYDDDDPTADNSRDVYYYAAEGVYNVTEKFYGAARYSHIEAEDGFPVVGNGDFGEYQFAELTTRMDRLSLGVGYRWSPDLVLKVDYTHDWGHTEDGEERAHEDMFAAELAFRF